MSSGGNSSGGGGGGSALRSVFRMFAIGAACAVGVVGFLAYNQASLIYIPRRYTQNAQHRHYYEQLKQRVRVTELPFKSSQGSQTAHYITNPKLSSRRGSVDADGTAPSPTAGTAATAATAGTAASNEIWVMFGGNGALALDHIDFIDRFYNTGTGGSVSGSGSGNPPPNHSFLLVDYPSYGLCDGKPSPPAILEQSVNAFDALTRHLRWNNNKRRDTTTSDEKAADSSSGSGSGSGGAAVVGRKWIVPPNTRVNILGHSLGSAASLQFAAHVTSPTSPDHSKHRTELLRCIDFRLSVIQSISAFVLVCWCVVLQSRSVD